MESKAAFQRLPGTQQQDEALDNVTSGILESFMFICIPVFISLLRYFSGDNFKSLSGLLSLFGE